MNSRQAKKKGAQLSSLKSDLVRRIQRLPKPTNVATALQPLFEAVSNSIHSTQAKFGNDVTKLGKIYVTVTIDRKKGNPSVTVEDNGLGLNEHNFQAFTTTDTANKIEIGGKGVGRLLWLDCFPSISVSSVYEDGENKKKRTFRFVLTESDQIQNEDISDAHLEPTTNFIVRFDGLRDNGYLAKFPGRKEYVFQHFTSHFLPTFIGGQSPQVRLQCGDEIRNYPEDIDSIVFRKSLQIKIETTDFGTLQFTLMECDRIASSDLKGSHFIHFIAHDRTVKSQSIDGKLGLKYFGQDQNRVFHGIIKGAYLDKNVNQERTAFMFEDAILDRIINDHCWPQVEEFLRDPIAVLREDQRKTIQEITESYPSVAFGELDDLQAKLPSGELNSDAIYGHLARERYRRDQKQGQSVRSVLTRLKEPGVNIDDFTGAISAAKHAIEEAEQKSLAEYVIRRKAVLDFIEILLEKVRDDSRDSSYQREDILHSFICPLRVSTLGDGSRKVEPSPSHDLWIIDERLTFAQYFSSDMSFTDISSLADSSDRADVLIFDYVHGLRNSDKPSSVLIVELKRPGRTSYQDDENPQMQVERYVRNLLKGGVDVRGRPIQLSPDTVFYCFIVADIVGKLDDWTFSWPRRADGRGRFFQPQSGFRGIIELVGWDSVIEDAKMRNQAFFEAAGLSGRSFFTPE